MFFGLVLSGSIEIYYFKKACESGTFSSKKLIFVLMDGETLFIYFIVFYYFSIIDGNLDGFPEYDLTFFII